MIKKSVTATIKGKLIVGGDLTAEILIRALRAVPYDTMVKVKRVSDNKIEFAYERSVIPNPLDLEDEEDEPDDEDLEDELPHKKGKVRKARRYA